MMQTENYTPSFPTPSPATTSAATAVRLSVFDMNTRAVVCLKEGRALEGMEALRDTLVHTRSLLIGQQQQQQQQGQAAPSSSSSAQVPPLSLFTVPLFTPPGDSEAAHCPLFDRAFVVGGDNDDSDNWMTDTHCQNVTLGVLLYNLALSHHLSGLCKGGTSQAAQEYQVAMNLYQMALSLVETSIRQPNTEECQNLVLLLCAIFNNMANIHSRHFHVQETRNCLEALKEIVSNNQAAATCTEEDQFFFYLNLFVTAPVHDFAIAPAA